MQREKVAALFGGLDTPVSIAIVPFANQAKVPFMGVWAAGTPITQNGAAENYVFRVSAVDDLVDVALVDYAIKKYGAKKPGTDPDQQSLGRVEREGSQGGARGQEPALRRHRKVRDQRRRRRAAADAASSRPAADVLLLVANVAPSAQVVKSLDRMGWNVPIVSHWGPSGGRFTELAGPSAAKVHFIQTFSFSGNSSPKAERAAGRAEEEISRDQVARRRHAGSRHRQRLLTRCI